MVLFVSLSMYVLLLVFMVIYLVVCYFLLVVWVLFGDCVVLLFDSFWWVCLFNWVMGGILVLIVGYMFYL